MQQTRPSSRVSYVFLSVMSFIMCIMNATIILGGICKSIIIFFSQKCQFYWGCIVCWFCTCIINQIFLGWVYSISREWLLYTDASHYPSFSCWCYISSVVAGTYIQKTEVDRKAIMPLSWKMYFAWHYKVLS